MRNQKMPNDPLKGFGMRRNASIMNRGDHDASVGDRCGKPAILADNPDDGRPHRFRMPQSRDQVWTYILFQIASSDGEHQESVFFPQAASL